ncbi:MAG: proteinral secretion pathway protein G [Elusimicrobia bacterium]|nr:MAG: proteinral secretion pathway protein G [Elusimicrobiota bacterium]
MRRRDGFTLIELMVVVAIIGILVSVAAARYNDTLRRANEGATRGNLGTVRSALRIYNADTEGYYPESLAVLAQGSRFLNRVPEIEVPFFHPDSNAVRLSASPSNDAGGWQFNNIPSDTSFGELWINCTHTDTSSSVWTSY